MHDYFEILGVSPDAAARDIRAACARHAARPVHDLFAAEQQPDRSDTEDPFDGARVPGLVDVAIDFPDLTAIVERMQRGFFR